MNPILRVLNFNSWSLGFKLVASLTLAMCLPVALTFAFVTSRARELETTNLQAFITQIGEERSETINNDVRLAREALAAIAEEERYLNRLLNTLTTDYSPAFRTQIVELLDNRLTKTGLYQSARLLNAEGTVIVSLFNRVSGVSSIPRTPPEVLEATRAAALLGEQQRIVVYENQREGIAVDVVQTILNNQGQTVGYLAGTLNLERLVLPHIEPIADFIPVYSYLATVDGLLIHNDGQLAEVEASAALAPVSSAVAGQSGVATLVIDGESIYAHYTPLVGTRFAIITQTTGSVFLVPPLGLIGATALPVVIALLIFVGTLATLLYLRIGTPINRMRDVLQGFARGNYDLPVPSLDQQDEIGTFARAFVNMRDEFKGAIADLEAQMRERVRDIQATQEVSRFAATQRNPERLMDEIVRLVANAFPNIYHAQIFLIDVEGIYAMLRASTGEPGRQLLQRGHRLAVGSVSVIGKATQEGRVVLEADTLTSPVHKPNPLLPETRSELAIPLRVGNTVIGALDVQSKDANSFTDDQIQVLSIMADQIAISLDNARLYQESVQRLEEINRSNRMVTRAAWEDQLYSQRVTSMVAEAGIVAAESGITPLRQQAMITGATAVGVPTANHTVPFAVPIRLRGEVLGAVEWELPLTEFSYDKVQLAEELVSRLAVSLDNARLFQQSQRTAERERIVNTIAAKLTGQTDVSAILQTAVREIGQALRAPQVDIHLRVENHLGGKTETLPKTDPMKPKNGSTSNGK